MPLFVLSFVKTTLIQLDCPSIEQIYCSKFVIGLPAYLFHVAAVQEQETELTEELWFFEKREEIPFDAPIPTLKHEWRRVSQ